METSSVYMCFPCYQEFDTLEEVLKHQLTCTAEEEKPTAPGTAVTVPLLHPQQQVINVARAIVQPLAQVQEPATTPKKDPVASVKVQDQPRILYQCGDCDELFKSLDLWQEHRKAGACLQSESKGKPDSEAKPETSTAQNPDIAVNPDNSSIPKDSVRENVTPEPEAEAAVTAVAVALEEGEKIPEAAPVERPGPPVTEARPGASNPDDSSPRRRDRNKKAKPEPVLLCVDCGSCFGMVPELVAHRKTQHGFEEALHRCGVCGESFLNTTLFLYHRKQHRQQGEEEEASQEVSSQNTVTEEPAQPSINVTVSFTQPDLFLCTQCGESCSTDRELLLHRKEKHGLQKPLHSCSQCGAEFMNTTQYLYHRRQHRFISDSTEEATMTVETVIAETQDTQCSKRILSPSAAAESASPLVKKSRPTFRVVSGGQKASKSDSEGGCAAPADPNATNYPPPAKLLQDWSRTPLPHVCPYCGKTFTRRVFLRTHVYSHTGEKLFTCKVCTKSFTNSQSLLRHSMCHTGAKPYSCNICGKSFSQTATLKRHQRLHNLTQPRRRRGRKPVSALGSEYADDLLSCPHCPSMFNTEEQLNYHKLLHTSHPFPCSDCGESFKRRKDLDLHSLTHQDKMPATCPHCSSQFINQTVLEIHLQRCPTTDDDRSAGRGRGQGRGRSTGQVECDLCGHRCMTQEGLDLHRLSHTGQTPLKCPVRPCRRRFISHSALEEHVLAHFQGTLHKSKSRSRFRCLTCHKEFAYNSTFKVHMRTHTDERPFECSTCGKRFRQLPHLQDHERIHSGLRPFCCWICGKSFSVAARLTEHARTHSGEKPYPCPHCPAAFRARANLEKHIRTHSDLPPETAAEAVNAAEAAHVQKVLEGAKVLSSLATTEMDTTAVQTIYVLQGADEGTETVMIPSDQLTGIDGNSQVVILPSSMLGTQTIAVPTITMDGNEITMVEADQSPQHSIEFIVEETV